MLLAVVAIVVVGAVVMPIPFAVLALTSARSLQRAVAAARAQLLPAVEEVMASAHAVAEQAQRLRPQP